MSPELHNSRCLNVKRQDLTPNTDKHKMRWHCWNLVGMVPHRVKKISKMQQIGLRSDDALAVEGYAFNSEPWGRHELQ